MLRSSPRISLLNVIRNPSIKLPTQKSAGPGHWHLRNLRHLIGVVARLEGFRDSHDYLLNATPPNDRARAQVLYGLVAVMSGNCWDLQRSHGLPLLPAAPASLEFLALHMSGQGVPQVANAFVRGDGAGVLSFRGTTTWRENVTDASASVAHARTLPLYGLAAVAAGPPPTYMSAFLAAFTHRDRAGGSMEGFVLNFVGKLKMMPNTSRHLIISGHSLGGAFAELAAYVAVQTGLTVTLTTFAPAKGSTASYCTFMQRSGAKMYTVINAQDYVPRLHSIFGEAVHCCPIVALNAAANNGSAFDRLRTHDPLYYGYVLLIYGSLPSLPKGVTCSRTDQTKASESLPPAPEWKRYESDGIGRRGAFGSRSFASPAESHGKSR